MRAMRHDKRLGVDKYEGEWIRCVNIMNECERDRWDKRKRFSMSPDYKSTIKPAMSK